MTDHSPYARLERLLTPHLADAVGFWSMRDGGRPVHLAGGGQDAPPSVGLEEHALWSRDRNGAWRPVDTDSLPTGERKLALAVREARLWMVVGRAPDRSGFAADDVERLRDGAILATQALEASGLSRRLLEARALADGAAHRWASMARVSGRLARSVELGETIEAVLSTVVPYLADCAFVDVLYPKGEQRRFVRHASEDWPDADAPPARFPFGESSVEDAIGALPDDGLRVRRWDDRAMERSVSPDEKGHISRLGPRSLVVLPLAIGEGRGGALTLVSGESGQEYDDRDMELFGQVAVQVGLALTSAITFTEAQRARREREEVLAIVSHDLKNPLNVLRFAASLLLMPGSTAERKREQIPVIDRAVDQMDALINNLLDASRIDAGRFSVSLSPVSPAPLVQEAIDQIKPLAEREQVFVESEIQPGLSLIRADRHGLLRVFGNLISNAISFSPPGGTVRIRASTATDGGVSFEVSDEGPGIEPDVLAHIFDRYWQAQRQGRAGAGLGLTIARGIVLAHGGTIDVDSEVGVGTSVHFTVPAAPSRSRELEPHAEHEESHGTQEAAHRRSGEVPVQDPR